MKKGKKIIPFKNYIIVAIMFTSIIILTLALRQWYRSYKDYQLTIPVISGKLQEINYNDFDNYIMEHDEFLLYIGVADDDNCRIIEKDLINVLQNRNLKNEVVYLNMTDVKNKNDYLNKFVIKYMADVKNLSYPSFVIMYNNKIIDFATKTSKQDLKISDIEKLLDEYELGD